VERKLQNHNFRFTCQRKLHQQDLDGSGQEQREGQAAGEVSNFVLFYILQYMSTIFFVRFSFKLIHHLHISLTANT
jgi:hypothetical protein